MKETTLTVMNSEGLHARPAAEFFKQARQFKSTITVQNLNGADRSEVPISAFYLLQIRVRQGHHIRLRADGEDEDLAIAALTELIESKFGED